MAKLGYARVSAADQSFETQETRLREAGCTIIRSEKASGKSRDGRGELATILDFIAAGDELVVCRLDRLGRSTRDVLNLVHELDAKGASLRVLDPEITTAGETGRMVITCLGMVADLELGFITERRRIGIDAKKAADAKLPLAQRTYKGRPKMVKPGDIAALRAEGLGPTEIGKRLGITRMTVHRELKRLDGLAAPVDPVAA